MEQRPCPVEVPHFVWLHDEFKPDTGSLKHNVLWFRRDSDEFVHIAGKVSHHANAARAVE